MSRPRILYLDMVPGEFVQETKLSGIGRYAAARGWEAVSIPERDSRPDKLKALLSAHRPVGCVVECTIGRRDLPPRLFGAVPVVYLDAYASLYGPRAARVAPDDGAIVRAAMRELSAGRPAAYAFVGYYYATPWERARQRAFREQAGAAAFREKRARKEAETAADDAARARRELTGERRKSARALETLRGSFSCRLGFALTWLPRKPDSL